MNVPKLSIIVPVYNAAPYLHRCIDSILSQSFSDYELLLIDDGSTDDSGKICDEYAAEDARIKVFHKENGGVSSARNLGLDEAQGEWVYFADADDEVKEHGLGVLIESSSEDTLFVMAGYECLDENDNVTYRETCSEIGFMPRNNAIMQMFQPHPYRYQGYLWNKLFCKHVIEQNHLRFDPSISFNEDRLFCIRYLCTLSVSDMIGYNWSSVYRYIERPTGAMSSILQGFNPKFVSDLSAFEQIGKLLRKERFSNDIIDAYAQSMYCSYRLYLSRMKIGRSFSIHIRMEAVSILISGIGCLRYISYTAKRIKRKFKRIICKNS